MFRKLTLALVAAASLGAMALAPTTASAGWKGGWHPHHHGHGFGIGFVHAGYGGYNGCYQVRRVLTPYGYRFRTVNVCAW